jgi:ubiquinone/menaquinone biosynthesis C-methylase UbiE
MNDKAYFSLYEDRFCRLREQGIEDWISDPEETKHIIESVNDFLNYAHCHPLETSIIEFGCGQGHLATHLFGCGYRYLGVDISESAILQAREKTGAKGQKAFLVADVTDLLQVPDNSFDIAIDNQCFHMLVTDEDRKKYLAEVKRVLKNDGKVYFRDNVQQEEFKAKITTFQEFVEKCYGDFSELQDYQAYIHSKRLTIRLPRIPARFNNEQGYRKELEEAGFKIEYFRIVEKHCIIYARLK